MNCFHDFRIEFQNMQAAVSYLYYQRREAFIKAIDSSEKNLINKEIISQRESARVMFSCCNMGAHGIFTLTMEVAA